MHTSGLEIMTMTTQTAYKCVKKMNTNVYSSQFGHIYHTDETITAEDEWGYCVLETLKAATQLLNDYKLESYECDQRPIWDAIVKVELITTQINVWAPHPGTIVTGSFRIMEEVY